MNARPALSVRWAMLLLGCFCVLHCMAQGKRGSLTKDFDKLSAKERSRIAAREAAEAAADTSYQGFMQRGDQAFQSGLYPQALALFEQARALRPFNVYPKVKIEDLQALIKQHQDRAAAATPAAPSLLAPDGHAVAPPAPEATTPPAQAAPPRQQTATAPSPRKPAPPDVAPRQQPPVAERPEPRGTTVPVVNSGAPAMQERIYREAGATVIERTVMESGMPVVYKKVMHAWGQHFHFRAGLAIPARQWAARFND